MAAVADRSSCSKGFTRRSIHQHQKNSVFSFSVSGLRDRGRGPLCIDLSSPAAWHDLPSHHIASTSLSWRECMGAHQGAGDKAPHVAGTVLCRVLVFMKFNSSIGQTAESNLEMFPDSTTT
ncbi:unnamed protein product [Polarella glacialis]|uniref:Uncharacterized protein n=1 Tax=Polarella glacialis TaxID=89957 RepID=A0A813LRB1_POLGL|nr:unnamed protein product [Polarella glacialis]